MQSVAASNAVVAYIYCLISSLKNKLIYND
jgi:hypothetical protein